MIINATVARNKPKSMTTVFGIAIYVTMDFVLNVLIEAKIVYDH